MLLNIATLLLLDCHVPYSRKLSREKTFANFAVLLLFAKVFPATFEGVVFFGAAKASNLRKCPAIQHTNETQPKQVYAVTLIHTSSLICRLTVPVGGITVCVVTTAVLVNPGTLLSLGFGTAWELTLVFHLLC